MESCAGLGTVLCAGHALNPPRQVLFRSPETQKTLRELSSSLSSDLTASALNGWPAAPAQRLFSSTKHFTARKGFMSFLVLHVPGNHFLPSSCNREWGQSFVPGAATTKHRHSAACSLLTRQMAQTPDAWKSPVRSPGKRGGQKSESFQVRQKPQTLFHLFDVFGKFSSLQKR